MSPVDIRLIGDIILDVPEPDHWLSGIAPLLKSSSRHTNVMWPRVTGLPSRVNSKPIRYELAPIFSRTAWHSRTSKTVEVSR